MKILKILIIWTIFILSIGAVSSSVPNLPMGLYGDIKIGTNPAPIDTKIDGKVGDQVVATTNVVNVGKYGDDNNYLGVYAPNEDENVDIYVNDVYATTIKYNGATKKRLDIDAPLYKTSSGSSDGTKNNEIGNENLKKVTPGSTEIQSPISPEQIASETPTRVADKPVDKSPETKETSFYSVSYVFIILILITTLKKNRML